MEQLKHKNLFFWLWGLCLLGSLSLFPYMYYLGVLPPAAPLLKILLMGVLQGAFLFGLICYLSYKIVPKTDLHPFAIANVWKQVVYPGVIAGAAAGLIIFTLDKTVFQSSMLSGVHPPFWAGALASIYGGVNEEVLLRLFLFTLVYFLFRKCVKNNRLAVLWITNILVAVVFGLGHLPAAFKLVAPSSFEVFRVLLLNGIPGIVFGWLYWSRGLWAAIAAHFMTDLMIHVFLV